MTCSYSMAHYREILLKARERYRLPLVSEVGDELPEDDIFLIRHDIDISPQAALNMARLEHQLGIRTSYYVRLHAPFYNAFEEETCRVLSEIAALGHELGLHYEPGFFERLGRDVARGIAGDIRAFESLFGFRSASVSQHEPSVGPLVKTLPDGYPCAYQAHLVVDMPYFGDSGFHWREGCVCTKIGRYPQIHTLIHPHSWDRDPIPWQDVLRQWGRRQAERACQVMEEHIRQQEEYLANRKRLDAERRARYDQRD